MLKTLPRFLCLRGRTVVIFVLHQYLRAKFFFLDPYYMEEKGGTA